MNDLDLAKDVWAHLGQSIKSLEDNSREAQLFNGNLKLSKTQVIYKAAPSDFIFPFKPSKVRDIADDLNPFKSQYHYFAYPTELLQMLIRDTRPANIGVAITRSFGGFSPINSNTEATTRPIFDRTTGKRAILSKNSNPVITGLFAVLDLSNWNPQLIESLSLYMAWKLSAVVTEMSTARDRLKKDFDMSIQDSRYQDFAQIGDQFTEQTSSIVQIIDFNVGQGLFNFSG